jgi:hypothetical protein
MCRVLPPSLWEFTYHDQNLIHRSGLESDWSYISYWYDMDPLIPGFGWGRAQRIIMSKLFKRGSVCGVSPRARFVAKRQSRQHYCKWCVTEFRTQDRICGCECRITLSVAHEERVEDTELLRVPEQGQGHRQGGGAIEYANEKAMKLTVKIRDLGGNDPPLSKSWRRHWGPDYWTGLWS